MRIFSLALAALCIALACGSCNRVKNALQTPEDYVRGRYGMPFATEEEYETACKETRRIEGQTVFEELQAWVAAYYAEDALFEQTAQRYDKLYNDLEELAFGVMYSRGNDEEAFKSLLVEAGYGENAEQCRALIEGLKPEGFLAQELAQMRQAHRVRLMNEIALLCEDLGEVDLAFGTMNTSTFTAHEPTADCVSRVYLTAEPAGGEITPGECPYTFLLHVDYDEKLATIGSARLNGAPSVTLGNDGEGKRRGYVPLKSLPMLTGEGALTISFHQY